MTWERVEFLVENHLRLVQAPKMRLSTLKRFLAQDGIEELLALGRIDALASNGNLEFVTFCEQQRATFSAEALRPPRLLSGTDLIALGYQRGQQIGEILRAVEEAQLEGELTTRDDALRLVAERFPVS